MNSSYFMELLNSLPNKWKPIEELVIRDVPKIPDEDNDFTFNMLVVELKECFLGYSKQKIVVKVF